jgi:hypothetical protein
MWRRTYLLLLLIRVYFALSPSYLHPDENFQGPEVYAGMLKFQRQEYIILHHRSSHAKFLEIDRAPTKNYLRAAVADLAMRPVPRSVCPTAKQATMSSTLLVIILFPIR